MVQNGLKLVSSWPHDGGLHRKVARTETVADERMYKAAQSQAKKETAYVESYRNLATRSLIKVTDSHFRSNEGMVIIFVEQSLLLQC